MILTKQSFLNLLQKSNIQEYIGMGNPNSTLLLVGSEKAFDLNLHQQIAHHELYNNWNHWSDILANYNGLENPYDKDLLNRNGHLKGFNPFNPLFLKETRQIVLPSGGHTYKKINGLINALHPNTNLDPEKSDFNSNVFSKCFITELSSKPATNQNKANFNLSSFIQSSRFEFLSQGDYSFYKDFKTVVLYFGKNEKYIGKIGSKERLAIIRIFDSLINHNDFNTISVDGFEFAYYQRSAQSARILLSYHAVSREFTNAYRNALSTLII